jgi:hypothetical protein
MPCHALASCGRGAAMQWASAERASGAGIVTSLVSLRRLAMAGSFRCVFSAFLALGLPGTAAAEVMP